MQTTRLLDWNCRLLQGGVTDEKDLQDIGEALGVMQEKWNLTHFCMMADYDCRRESVSAFLLRREKSLQRIKPYVPQSLTLIPAASVPVLPDVSFDPGLDKLLLPVKKGYLPLAMPLGAYESWIDEELNRLLFQRKYHLLFLSFETCMTFYPQDVIERLFRIPNAVFQFHYRTLADPKYCRLFASLYSRGIYIAFGTALNAPQKLGFLDLDYCLLHAKARLSDTRVRQLLCQVPSPFGSAFVSPR